MKIKDLKKLYPEIDKYYKNEILKSILKLSNEEMLLSNEREITLEEKKIYENKISKLLSGEPLQYIENKAYFLGNEYYVDNRVLIPRPETEYLVEDTIKLITKYNLSTILEVGTGSGIIATSLKRHNNKYKITACDISKDALEVAKYNAKQLNTEINFVESDVFSNIKEKYDVLISNPPYIKNNSMYVEDKVKNYEPNIALYGGDDGLDFYRRMLKNANQVLKKKNIIAFEIGENQADSIESIAKEYYPNANIIKKKDLNNYDRYLYIINE